MPETPKEGIVAEPSEPSDRMRKLRVMLEKQPNDPFLLYGIALEHKKAGRANEAIGFLERVIQLDPGYCYAYHQKGMVHESTGDSEAARRSYREGVQAATRKGDMHAKGEIEAALDMLGE